MRVRSRRLLILVLLLGMVLILAEHFSRVQAQSPGPVRVHGFVVVQSVAVGGYVCVVAINEVSGQVDLECP